MLLESNGFDNINIGECFGCYESKYKMGSRDDMNH